MQTGSGMMLTHCSTSCRMSTGRASGGFEHLHSSRMVHIAACNSVFCTLRRWMSCFEVSVAVGTVLMVECALLQSICCLSSSWCKRKPSKVVALHRVCDGSVSLSQMLTLQHCYLSVTCCVPLSVCTPFIVRP